MNYAYPVGINISINTLQTLNESNYSNDYIYLMGACSNQSGTNASSNPTANITNCTAIEGGVNYTVAASQVSRWGNLIFQTRDRWGNLVFATRDRWGNLVFATQDRWGNLIFATRDSCSGNTLTQYSCNGSSVADTNTTCENSSICYNGTCEKAIQVDCSFYNPEPNGSWVDEKGQLYTCAPTAAAKTAAESEKTVQEAEARPNALVDVVGILYANMLLLFGIRI